MANYILVEGDGSDHAGNIISGSTSKTKAGGIRIAYIGLPVSDDALGDPPNTIATSNTRGITKFNGISVAANGAATGCGGSLIASNTKTRIV